MQRVRVATWNVSMYRSAQGALADDLATGDDPQALLIAQVLAEVRPDVLLLNEIDHDPAGRPVDLLADRYLAPAGLKLRHRLSPPVNTGVPSGLDLNGDGTIAAPPGSREAAGDCWGYGVYPGQYGLAVLSRFPLGEARTFRKLLWASMPDNQLQGEPALYPPDVAAQVRLSSKTHLDVRIDVGPGIHLLASHPTPPVFDGPEDRNGRRNHDELRLWSDYVTGQGWMTDDAGRTGGLEDGPFVIVGDQNNDPFDGDGRHDAVLGLIAAAGRQPLDGPTSLGAPESAALAPEANGAHAGPAAMDTIAIDSIGNLRLDYALPSADLQVLGQGVYWPTHDDPRFEAVGDKSPFPVSDHRLVWVDVVVPI
ncbi:MAG: endonuclease/exonuclease/phosphatase family protein [Microthrixaceae bacterium]